MDRARNIAIIVVCLALLWPIGEAALTVREYRRHQGEIAASANEIAISANRLIVEELKPTLAEIKAASVALKQTAVVQAEIAGDPNTKEKIELSIAHAHRIMKRVDTTIDILNDRILPKTDQILVICRDGSKTSLDGTNQIIAQVIDLLKDPRLREVLTNLAATTDNVKGLTVTADATARQIEVWLPDMLAEVKLIAQDIHGTTDNVEGISKAALSLANRAAQPLSRKEKFFLGLLKVLTVLSPSLIELIRR